LLEANLLPAPNEVRYFIDEDETEPDLSAPDVRVRNAKMAVSWLLNAVGAAHLSEKLELEARMLLGSRGFTTQMHQMMVWDDFKQGLEDRLQELGLPLKAYFESERVREVLSSIHESIQIHSSCAGVLRGRRNSVCRQGLSGVVPVPRDWDFDDLTGLNERAYIHVLILIALAIAPMYHQKIQELIGHLGTYKGAPPSK
jgi:hypothetical protein